MSKVGQDSDGWWVNSRYPHAKFPTRKDAVYAGRRGPELRGRRRHARKNPSSNTTLLIVAGLGAIGIGVGIYFLTKKSGLTSSSSLQISSGGETITLFEVGKTYSFTAPLPPGMPIDPNAVKSALEAVGWTNVSISSITPGTYTATGTWQGPTAASLPQGTTATLV